MEMKIMSGAVSPEQCIKQGIEAAKRFLGQAKEPLWTGYGNDLAHTVLLLAERLTLSSDGTIQAEQNIDRNWWRERGADACIDRMVLMNVELERLRKLERAPRPEGTFTGELQGGVSAPIDARIEAMAQWVEKCADAQSDSKAKVAKSIRLLGVELNEARAARSAITPAVREEVRCVVHALRTGICDDPCKMKNAGSGCDCAIAADLIEKLALSSVARSEDSQPQHNKEKS